MPLPYKIKSDEVDESNFSRNCVHKTQRLTIAIIKTAMKKQNNYRKNIRLQTWDYSWEAAYFITIGTFEKQPYFGSIKDSEMQLSPQGVLANVLWFEVKNRVANISLGEFITMPNHIHAILVLDPPSSEENQKIDLLSQKKFNYSNRFQNIGERSVSSIVGNYKSSVTKHANRLGLPFKWQTRFHDHIIRDEKSFQLISQYIQNNPKNWTDDVFHIG